MSDRAAAPAAVASGGDVFVESEEHRSLAQRIRNRVAEAPGGIIRSYREDGQHLTQSHAALWRRSADIAAALSTLGAQPSALVVILAEDILDFLPALWACLRGGFVAVPLMGAARDWIYRNDTTFHVTLAVLNKYYVLVDDAFFGLAESRTKALPGTVVTISSIGTSTSWTDHDLIVDPAWLVGTSGSTGRLKLVELSNSALTYRYYGRNVPLVTAVSHTLGIFPLDTVTGQIPVCLQAETHTHLSSKSLATRPTIVLDAIEHFGITRLDITSSMIGRILHEEAKTSRSRNLASLMSVGVGAEPIATRHIHEFAQLLNKHGAKQEIFAGYGTTETGALVVGSPALLTARLLDPVCLGPPQAGVSMRIVDAERTIAASGETGELEVSCPKKMFSGYWGDPDLTRNSFTPDGWWKTGDLGRLIDGQLYLHGRAKEVFIQNGKKFSFADIDSEMHNAMETGDVAHAFGISHPGEQDRLAVVFAVSWPSCPDDAAGTIKTALARRFGLYPSLVFETVNQRIPRTAAGKVQRRLLNDLVSSQGKRAANSEDHHVVGNASSCREQLEAIWNIALGLDGPVTPESNFLDAGGDSLRSLSLHHQIIDAFGVHISSEDFFAKPTFETLLRLVEHRRAAPIDLTSSGAIRWPLPALLHNSLMSALETWPGERPTKARTVLANNVGGMRPPIFWVFNTSLEITQLATALGEDQPLYAFRSGVEITDYDEDDVQALALRYLSDVEEICPDGPFFIGGNCQGGTIALAIAQHALRRKRHIPLLVLMDWSFPLQPFTGHVLLVSGRDNFNHNATRRFNRPELAWKRAFASHEFAEIPGGYAQGFDQGNIDVLIGVLTSRMRQRLLQPSTIMPASGYQGTVSVHDVPRIMESAARATIKVVVSQDSDVAWGTTEQSGVVVGSRWLDNNGHVLEVAGLTASLPAMAPHSSAALDMEIIAPANAGAYTLNIELCEEGNKWFGAPDAGFGASISVGSSICAVHQKSVS